MNFGEEVSPSVFVGEWLLRMWWMYMGHGGAASLLFVVGATSHGACLHCRSAWELIHRVQPMERLHSGCGLIDVGRGSSSIVFGRGSGFFGPPSPISTVAVDGSCICPLQGVFLYCVVRFVLLSVPLVVLYSIQCWFWL